MSAYELAKEFTSIGVKKGWELRNKHIAQGGESFYSGVGGNKAHYGAEKIIEALKNTQEKYREYIKLKKY